MDNSRCFQQGWSQGSTVLREGNIFRWKLQQGFLTILHMSFSSCFINLNWTYMSISVWQVTKFMMQETIYPVPWGIAINQSLKQCFWDKICSSIRNFGALMAYFYLFPIKKVRAFIRKGHWLVWIWLLNKKSKWAGSCEYSIYHKREMCRWACASAQSCQRLHFLHKYRSAQEKKALFSCFAAEHPLREINLFTEKNKNHLFRDG